MDIKTGSLATAWICITTGPEACGAVQEPMFCLSRVLNPVDVSNPDRCVLPRKRGDVNEASGWLNFDLLRQWIVACKTHHGNACNFRSGFKRNTLDTKLIDTKSLEVVSGKGMQPYAALSYVWGSPRQARKYQFRSNFRLGFASLPATMQDARQCTSQLGLQYLWIDQYCIDQANEDQKRMQIQMMDLVYECAEVVLIASDGSSVDAGLAGISRPLKHSHKPAFTSGDLEVMATYVNCPYERDIAEPWNQRGWTLQEGLLARRRICFGSSHYYMRCEQEVFSGLLPVDLSVGRIRMESLGSFRYSYGILGIELKSDEWSFDTYANFVERYTRRKLTDPDDVLNACNGILNKFTKNARAAFFRGLPSNDISRGLLWEVGTFVAAQRRPRFPSWTWTGWIGRTLYKPWLMYSTPTPAPPTLRNSDEAYREAMRKHEEVCADIARVLPMKNSEALIEFSTPGQDIATVRTGNRLLTISSLSANIGLKLLRKNGSPVEIAASPEDYELTAWGDHWTLLDSAGTQLLNTAFVWTRATGYDVFQERDYFFHTHSDVSETLQAGKGDIVAAELVFIKHWPAVRAGRKSDSWIFDMVSTLVVVKSDDGTTWRLAAVLLTREQWTSLQPQSSVTRLV